MIGKTETHTLRSPDESQPPQATGGSEEDVFGRALELGLIHKTPSGRLQMLRATDSKPATPATGGSDDVTYALTILQNVEFELTTWSAAAGEGVDCLKDLRRAIRRLKKAKRAAAPLPPQGDEGGQVSPKSLDPPPVSESTDGVRLPSEGSTPVTDEMVTAAMRAFEGFAARLLRYPEKDRWHMNDVLGMREAIKAALAARLIKDGAAT